MDPARGLLFVDADAPSTRQLCGAGLENSEVPQLLSRLDAAERDFAGDAGLVCAESPELGLYCGGAGWDLEPAIYVGFARTGGHLRLDYVVVIDEFGLSADSKRHDTVWKSIQHAIARKRRCEPSR